jgi:predicted nucleic acid-binding protein
LRRSCVVDASVGVKLFLPEELSENATELFREIAGVRKRFFVPDLFYAECANIFWKSVRRLVIPSDEARDSLQDLKGLSLLPVATSGLLAESLDLALEFGITAYDATYAALSQDLSLPLITADEKLIRKLEGSGTNIVWLGDLTT